MKPFCVLTEPNWVALTLRMLPVPIFAFAVMATMAAISIFCAMMGTAEPSPILWSLCSMFGAISALILVASITRHVYRLRVGNERLPRYADTQSRPTFAILVLLISVYSWTLTIVRHVLKEFFAANPGDPKYFVTLGIAVASSVYMSVHGRYILAKHFGKRGGRNIVVTPSQAALIVLLMVAFGLYFAWLMM